MPNRILVKWVKAAEVNCSVPHFSVGETWIFFEAKHRRISGGFEHWNPSTSRKKKPQNLPQKWFFDENEEKNDEQ